jgi:caffeoyl-CoA O-methyltransferase
MNKSFGNDDEKLEAYVARVYRPEDEALRDARARADRAGLPDIQVAPLDARHLEVLVRACGARTAVEIGTLAGYSGLSLLRGLGPGGVLHTFELDPAHADVARETFRRAGLLDRARIHVGRAADELPKIEGEGPFDLCFIDADKESYPAYLDWAARNLRPGGVVLADNAFAFGTLREPLGAESSAATRAMNAFHERLAGSGEFRATVLPTGEGLAMGVRI